MRDFVSPEVSMAGKREKKDSDNFLSTFWKVLCHNGGFSGSSAVKNLPAMQEMWVWSLGREDPLEERMVTHSSIFAWRIPWTEEPGRLQSMGLQSRT